MNAIGINRRQNAAAPNRAERFQNLVEEVLKKSMVPEDRLEVAAILESMGWNDDRAAETFEVEDIFELASEIWEQISRKIVTTAFTGEVKTSTAKMTYELVKSFLRGLIFALPMAISVASMLTLKFSLWSYENLSVELATCIAIGTILSFVVVGGYTQAIARRGFFYIYQGYYNMARKVTFSFIRYGYITCLAASGLLYLFNLIFNIFPIDMFGYIALYFFFLNSIWLSVTVMYILRKELIFTGLIIVGIGGVYVLFVLLEMDIIFAQLIAILFVSIVGMVMVMYFFKAAAKKEEKGIAPKMPRSSITVYSVMPYFTYGFLYFSFLYVDRIMAWSANSGTYMPYVIWFRGEYELGLDFALLALMIPLGVCEVIVNKLMLDVEASYKSYWGFEADRMNNHFQKVYNRLLLIISGVSIGSALLIYLLIKTLNRTYMNSAGKALIATAKTEFVFIIGLVAYVILAVALMNAVILFSLSQAQRVNRSILPALSLNFIVGFLLSRWIDFSYAVFGALSGCILFLILSIQAVRQVFRKLDFHLYEIS